jgi:O-antigen/teichoic acid export membrane protein
MRTHTKRLVQRVLLVARDGDKGIMLRGSAGALLIKSMGIVLSFLASVLVARSVGATHYGIYALSLVWINFFVLASKMGLDLAAVRFVAGYDVKQQWGPMRGLVSSGHWIVASAALPLAAIVFVALRGLDDAIGRQQADALSVGLLLVPVLALTGLRQGILRGLRRVVLAELPEMVLRPVGVGLFCVIAVWISGGPIDSHLAIILNLLATILALTVGGQLLRKALPGQVARAKAEKDTAVWMRTALPLMWIAGMYMLLSQTDTAMVGALLGSEQAGIYSVASRIAGFVSFGLVAVNAIMAPLIARLYADGDKVALQEIIRLSARVVFAATCAFGLIISAFGRQVLGLYGEEFLAGQFVLVILVLGQIANGFMGSVGFLMTMTGHQAQAAKMLSVAAGANLLANFWLIRVFGIEGAACATAIGLVSINVAMFTFVRHRLALHSAAFGGIG